ncbi:MAG: DnaA regulatory inactivator Hda, partial [Dokdonella sp.]
PLALRWPANQTFDDFLESAGNVLALSAIRRSAMESAAWIFVAGPAASGKTHLLTAACVAANAAGCTAQYLSLSALGADRAAAIRAFGGSDLLAIDNIDSIAGDGVAEHALFDLYNRCKGEGAKLLFSARTTPAQLGLTLPDLQSRFAACTQFQVRALDESERRELIRQRAAARGIEFDDAVLDWLFVHKGRDLTTLGGLLDRIDTAALAAKRRVTVPFLRQLLN